MLIPEFLEITASLVPDRTAISFEGQKFTFTQLKDRVNQVADALVKLGVKKGDRVGVFEVNCNEYIEALFGTIKAGAIFTPMNFRVKEEDLVYLVNKVEPKVMFMGTRYAPMALNLKDKMPSIKNVIVIDGNVDGAISYDDFIKTGSPEDKTFAEVKEEDTALVMFTAGTTGFPKGVPQDHNAYSAYVMANVNPPDPEATAETNVVAMPFYHVAGMQALMSAIYGGRTIALMRQFEEKEWFETVQETKATRVMVVPTMLKRIVEFPDFDKYNLSSIKVITYGASACPYEILRKTLEKFPGRAIINAFGGTETSSTIASLRAEDQVITGKESPAEREKKLKRISSSIGVPQPDVKIEIRSEDGKVLPSGDVGEIVVKGDRIMKGYWKDEEKTKKAFTKDGWYRTGDMGYFDKDGYIYLTGRSDDLIKRGGENVGPDEVESAIYSHPKVDEAAAIPVPDLEWGNQVRAVVRLKPGQTMTEKEMLDFLKGRMAAYKRPTSVVFVTEELPKTATGKILRRSLREKYGKP